MQVQSSANISQLELFKNFEQPITINNASVVIRSVSTKPGQFFIMSKDLANALTGETDPKKLRRCLVNAKEKAQRSSSEKKSILINENGITATLLGALLNLKVCIYCFVSVVQQTNICNFLHQGWRNAPGWSVLSCMEAK